MVSRGYMRWADMLLVIAYAATSLALVLAHEPWRDEADVWLMARDRSVPEVLQLARRVATPTLWHMTVMPLAKLGLPYGSMAILNWGYAVAAVAILALASPFPRWFRWSLAFSYFSLYEYAVVARSYMLSVLLLFATTTLFRRRDSHPVALGVSLGLFCNTNAHSLILGTILLGLWIREGRSKSPQGAPRARVGLVVAALGVLSAVLQLVPSRDGQMMAAVMSWRPNWAVAADAMREAFLPRSGEPLLLAVALAVIAASAASLRQHRLPLALLLTGVFGLLAFFVLVYAGAVRHWGFVMLTCVAALWIGLAEAGAHRSPLGSPPGVGWLGIAALGLSLPASLLTGSPAMLGDWRGAFSGAREMGRFVDRLDLKVGVVAAHPAEMGEAVLPYLTIPRMYYPAIDDFGSHMKWDRVMLEGRSLGDEEILRRIERRFPPEVRILLIVNRPLPVTASRGFTLRHVSRATVVTDESFWLYERASRTALPASARTPAK